ncbi:MAG: YkyA family protein [Turicibacter sp.]|nr:YkyA family protein [Turicibacter sp.]
MKSRLIILFMLLVILGGCSSENEKKVFSLLNDQIVKQNECNTNNQAVTDLMSEETIIYNDIIEQGFESGNEVQGLIEEGWTNVKNSQVYLEEYQTCILNTQVNPEELKKVNENIADEEIRANTETLIQQYIDYEQSLVSYVESLIHLNATQQLFYQEIKTNLNSTNLDELVREINVAIEEANTLSYLHQEALDLFNTTYNEYYEAYIK